MKQKYFCVMIALTHFVKNTCDKMFITFAQIGQAFIQTVLLITVFEQRLGFRKL